MNARLNRAAIIWHLPKGNLMFSSASFNLSVPVTDSPYEIYHTRN